MRLLITTQTVDRNDPVLGFFHHWLETFATHFDSIEVICLSEGTHALPDNVRVHSLGKERGGNRFLYALRFVWLAWGLRSRYDAVFVHMNPEYILLAGDLWRMTGKRIGLWYNHEVGSVALRIAAPIAHLIFHTSPYAYTARYRHARRMPAGIDTDLFKPSGAARPPRSVYMQGRVSPAKNVHVVLEALALLKKQGEEVTATIVGPIEHAYGVRLHQEFDDLLDGDGVLMRGPVRNEETPALYAAHAVAVNLAADGNYDKTVLEAAACETPVMVASKAFVGIIQDDWVLGERNPETLAAALSRFFSLSEHERLTFGESERRNVVAREGLETLATLLARVYYERT